MRWLFTFFIIGTLGWWFFGHQSQNEPEYGVGRGIFSESDCSSLEPENPYSIGSGHYAGYEWAENRGGGYCSGNSNSFVEGCEEYDQQETAYDACVNR